MPIVCSRRLFELDIFKEFDLTFKQRLIRRKADPFDYEFIVDLFDGKL